MSSLIFISSIFFVKRLYAACHIFYRNLEIEIHESHVFYFYILKDQMSNTQDINQKRMHQ